MAEQRRNDVQATSRGAARCLSDSGLRRVLRDLLRAEFGDEWQRYVRPFFRAWYAWPTLPRLTAVRSDRIVTAMSYVLAGFKAARAVVDGVDDVPALARRAVGLPADESDVQ